MKRLLLLTALAFALSGCDVITAVLREPTRAPHRIVVTATTAPNAITGHSQRPKLTQPAQVTIVYATVTPGAAPTCVLVCRPRQPCNTMCKVN